MRTDTWCSPSLAAHIVESSHPVWIFLYLSLFSPLLHPSILCPLVSPPSAFFLCSIIIFYTLGPSDNLLLHHAAGFLLSGQTWWADEGERDESGQEGGWAALMRWMFSSEGGEWCGQTCVHSGVCFSGFYLFHGTSLSSSGCLKALNVSVSVCSKRWRGSDVSFRSRVDLFFTFCLTGVSGSCKSSHLMICWLRHGWGDWCHLDRGFAAVCVLAASCHTLSLEAVCVCHRCVTAQILMEGGGHGVWQRLLSWFKHVFHCHFYHLCLLVECDGSIEDL